MNSRNILLAGAATLALIGVGTISWYWGSAERTGQRSGSTAPPRGVDVSGTASVAADAGGRRILYYRNAMGLPDTSPVPKKDAMGMDYVAVYADEQSAGAQVRISADKLQKLGVRTAAAAPHVLTQTLRIVGTLQPDEGRQSSISPRFEGWITRLLVSTTGAAVRRGQALLEVYSPDLISAQQDYRIATRALQTLGDADTAARSAMESLVQSSLERLRNWGVAEADLAALEAGKPAQRNVILRAPSDGVVTAKTATVGMRFMPGDALYQIADLSMVWLVASVFEQDLALLRLGAPATVTVVAYPGESFRGIVTFISPVLQPETRTAQVRVELANPRGRLKPAMYGSVELKAGSPTPRLAVPDTAILDTGTRQLVLIDRGSGAFEPRTVRAGVHADGYTEILGGVVAGESVVVNGNFLIDSESNLRAAIHALGPNGQKAATEGANSPAGVVGSASPPAAPGH
jgi:membrane fusion protein, copper/silver efflux system